MKLNLTEVKKWSLDNNYLYNMIVYVIDNNIENSIEVNTLIDYKIYKNKLIDLQELENLDTDTYEKIVCYLFSKFINKEQEQNNVNYDIDHLMKLNEEDILKLNDTVNVENDLKNTTYFNMLKNGKYIDKKGKIDLSKLDEYFNIKLNFINNSINMIKEMGIDYNEEVKNCLIELKIIEE